MDFLLRFSVFFQFRAECWEKPTFKSTNFKITMNKILLNLMLVEFMGIICVIDFCNKFLNFDQIEKKS